jgi:hypothetical protein
MPQNPTGDVAALQKQDFCSAMRRVFFPVSLRHKFLLSRRTEHSVCQDSAYTATPISVAIPPNNGVDSSPKFGGVPPKTGFAEPAGVVLLIWPHKRGQHEEIRHYSVKN